MAMSTFQKVTLATCLVLCVALLLPKMLLSRGRKDAAERPEGHFPPMMHRQVAPEGRGQRATSSGYSRTQNSEAAASRGKGAGAGAGTGGKSNLAGQIIPVYGFGILLYILYILFKITSKGNNKPSDSRFTSVRSENVKRKITDYELAQLQEKLRETELVMEKIVSSAHHSSDRVNGVMTDQEESLLQQLTEITRVMQEGQLVEGMGPERKARNDWEDYSEEPHPYWEHSCCSCQQHYSTQAETETERTEADGADTAEDATGGTNAEEDLGPNTDTVFIPQSEDNDGPQRDLGTNEREDFVNAQEDESPISLSVPQEEQGEDLKELEPELELETTFVGEQDKLEDLNHPVETESCSSQVRRRNRRKRAKKVSH